MGTSADVQEVKMKADLVTVVSRYVKLKKAGRNYTGLCPFHNEKTPSFHVNPTMNIYKCFGCGKTGDVISFIQEIEHLEFSQALEKLAHEFGVTLHTSDDPELKKVAKLREAYRLVTEFYHYILTQHKMGQEALDYALNKRHLSVETIKKNKIGYAPKEYKLVQSLLIKKGYTQRELYDGGFLNEKGFDKFTDRLMFPIYDVAGHAVGFSGRVIQKDDIRPKYLNTPETILYKKRYLLFGLYQAKDDIAKQNLAILCEGQIDTISSQQAGVLHIVAPLGTGLTDTQVGLLKRYTPNVAFCFDNDTAGQKSILKGVQLALVQDMRPFMIQLPDDVKDIDELVQKRPDDWKDRATHPLDFFELQITLLKQLLKKDMVAFEKKLQEVISVVVAAPELKQNIIAKQLSEALGLSEEGIHEALKKNTPVQVNREALKQKQGALTTAEYVLSIVMTFPLVTLLMGKPEVAAMYFPGKDQQELYATFADFAVKHMNLVTSVIDKKTKTLTASWDSVYTRFTNELYQEYASYITKIQQEHPAVTALLEKIGLSEQASSITINDDIMTDFFSAWLRLKRQVLTLRLEQLRQEVSSAEVGQQEERIETLQSEIYDALERLRKIEKKIK